MEHVTFYFHVPLPSRHHPLVASTAFHERLRNQMRARMAVQDYEIVDGPWVRPGHAEDWGNAGSVGLGLLVVEVVAREFDVVVD